MALNKKTHCIKGHLYEPSNIRMSKNANGTYSQKCKKCNRLRGIWYKMLARCYSANAKDYKDYQGKGIVVCEDWHSFGNFEKWALLNGYEDKLTIDRIDNELGYSPENCRWATLKEQANNKRNNHNITAFGNTRTLQQWSEKTGIGYKTILYRIRSGWGVEKALSIKPVIGGNKGVL